MNGFYPALGRAVSRHWGLLLIAWLAAVVGLKFVAPAWDNVTLDGDLAYLPSQMPSVVGEKLLVEAFPDQRAKSQLVFVVEDQRKSSTGPAPNAAGSGRPKGAPEVNQVADFLSQRFEAALSQANAHRQEGRPGVPEWPLLDVWSRHTEIAGQKLLARDGKSELVVLQLENEFMATDNIRLMDLVDRELAAARQQAAALGAADWLEVGITGSAAVGGDMLRASKESIANTEMLTVVLVGLILAFVYRAPLLVAVPLVTLVVSVSVALSLVSLMADAARAGHLPFDFKVFKTTKIFIVVVLYGSGTDYCLFLIARYREELEAGLARPLALAQSLAAVGNALAASAFTTVVGLGMMLFADFGKFKNSGPTIALCLCVVLVACVTFTPALMRLFGPLLFWPFGVRVRGKAANAITSGNDASLERLGVIERLWQASAELIMRRPGFILAGSFIVGFPFALVGWSTSSRVTYDFPSELGEASVSRHGAAMLHRHFPVGENGPLTILVSRAGASFGGTEKKPLYALGDLTKSLYEIESVVAVRSQYEPLGDRPKGRLSARELSAKSAMQAHVRTKALYLSSAPGFAGDVARLDIVFDCDPFSFEALEAFERIERALAQEIANSQSYWHGAQFVYAGVTAGIRDLRAVTTSDNQRLQWLVLLAVLLVVLVVLGKPIICLFLVLSVLYSFYVAMGASELYFQWAYGDTYQGLDWKVPLFLFVILVAIGEDYNLYLVTRVYEEQALRGPRAGLKAAIALTGSIISSCGLIMAGSFVAMCTGTLRGIVELGFALTLGVILDTFYVRPFVVPAFMALVFRDDDTPAADPSHAAAPGETAAQEREQLVP